MGLLGDLPLSERISAIITQAANDIMAEMGRPGATPNSGLDEWYNSNDTGLSSRFMAYILSGNNRRAEYAHPHDPADFGRCLRLLEAAPELRERLHMMAECTAVWERYVQHWEEMEDLYNKELPTGRAPELYALMHRLAGVKA